VATTIDVLRMRAMLGVRDWHTPVPWGANGWMLRHDDGSSVIVSCATWPDGAEWVHASMTHPDRTPSYDELKLLHAAVWRGRGYAYQVFAPDDKHIDGLEDGGHPHALHLWGRLDGVNPLPDFAVAGSI
jgi:hypothetical protein